MGMTAPSITVALRGELIDVIFDGDKVWHITIPEAAALARDLLRALGTMRGAHT